MKAVFLDLASLAEQDLDLSEFERVVDEWRSYPATAALTARAGCMRGASTWEIPPWRR